MEPSTNVNKYATFLPLSPLAFHFHFLANSHATRSSLLSSLSPLLRTKTPLEKVTNWTNRRDEEDQTGR